MVSFHHIFTIFYFLLELLLFYYKGLYFEYAPHSMSVEIVCLIFYLFINLIRSRLGSLGNRSEASTFILFNLILVVSPLYTYGYFLFLQTYSMKLEVIINAFGWFITVMESVFAIVAMGGIKKQEGSM